MIPRLSLIDSVAGLRHGLQEGILQPEGSQKNEQTGNVPQNQYDDEWEGGSYPARMVTKHIHRVSRSERATSRELRETTEDHLDTTCRGYSRM